MLEGLIFIADIAALDYLLDQKLKNKEVGPYELRVGYRDFIVFRKPIIINMKATPHLFVCGLSGSGKSKMVEYAVKDKNVVLLNVFPEDFKSITARRIIGNDEILEYLTNLLKDMKGSKKRDTPLYVVVDELLVLCMDKAITKAIMDILAIGRHYNIYLIGISQTGTKESVKFKDLFNARICFRQVEESAYRTILGYSPEKKNLKHREFYLYSDRIERGYTYTIS